MRNHNLTEDEAADLALGLAQSAAGETEYLGSFAQDAEDTPYQKAILKGLQSKPVYRGTVPAAVVAKRRAKNKVARKSRQANRH